MAQRRAPAPYLAQADLMPRATGPDRAVSPAGPPSRSSWSAAIVFGAIPPPDSPGLPALGTINGRHRGYPRRRQPAPRRQPPGRTRSTQQRARCAHCQRESPCR